MTTIVVYLKCYMNYLSSVSMQTNMLKKQLQHPTKQESRLETK